LGIELKEAIDRPLKERKKEGGNAGVLALLIALAGSQGRSLPVINRSAFPALIFTRDVFD
jgi:hypothetical protein